MGRAKRIFLLIIKVNKSGVFQVWEMWEERKEAHEAMAECVTLNHATLKLDKLQQIKFFFISKYFNITRKPAFAHFDELKKSHLK